MRSVILKTEMVLAVLDGRKTQMRLLIKPQPVLGNTQLGTFVVRWNKREIWGKDKEEVMRHLATLAPHRVGDVLYVRETWQPDTCTIWMNGQYPVAYKATDYRADIKRGPYGAHWRPSVQMPQWAARLFLEITDVRVEQVQDITFGDAIADGGFVSHGMRSESRAWYKEMWDSIYAKKGLGWDANPWVWVYTFKIIDKPEEV